MTVLLKMLMVVVMAVRQSEVVANLLLSERVDSCQPHIKGSLEKMTQTVHVLTVTPKCRTCCT